MFFRLSMSNKKWFTKTSNFEVYHGSHVVLLGLCRKNYRLSDVIELKTQSGSRERRHKSGRVWLMKTAVKLSTHRLQRVENRYGR